jgi:hypothetical protein
MSPKTVQLDDVRSRLGPYHVLAGPRREAAGKGVLMPSSNFVRWCGLAAMLGGALGVVLGPVLAHLWAGYSSAYWAYGRLYILSLPPELVALHVLRKLRAGGSRATERWGFRVSLVGMWLMAFGVFADYSGVFTRLSGFGFFTQMVAAPVLLVGFALLGIGLGKEGAVPRWVALVMVGAVVGTVPVTLLLVNHMPSGPLELLHAAWIVLGYVLFSQRGLVAAQPAQRVS